MIHDMAKSNVVVPIERGELEALRADAARYQFIREGNLYQGPRAVWFNFADAIWEPCKGEQLDENTDFAIARLAGGLDDALALVAKRIPR